MLGCLCWSRRPLHLSLLGAIAFKFKDVPWRRKSCGCLPVFSHVAHPLKEGGETQPTSEPAPGKKLWSLAHIPGARVLELSAPRAEHQAVREAGMLISSSMFARAGLCCLLEGFFRCCRRPECVVAECRIHRSPTPHRLSHVRRALVSHVLRLGLRLKLTMCLQPSLLPAWGDFLSNRTSSACRVRNTFRALGPLSWGTPEAASATCLEKVPAPPVRKKLLTALHFKAVSCIPSLSSLVGESFLIKRSCTEAASTSCCSSSLVDGLLGSNPG